MPTELQKIQSMMRSKAFKKLSKSRQAQFKKKVTEIKKMQTWIRNNSMSKVRARWKKKGMM